MATNSTPAWAQSWQHLSSGWKVVYSVFGIGVLVILAQTQFAPLVVALLVAGIIYQLEHA